MGITPLDQSRCAHLIPTHSLLMLPPRTAVTPTRGPAVTPTAFLGHQGMLQPWEIIPFDSLPLLFPAGTLSLVRPPSTSLPVLNHSHPQILADNLSHRRVIGFNSSRSSGLDLSRYRPQAGTLLTSSSVCFSPLPIYHALHPFFSPLVGFLRDPDDLEAQDIPESLISAPAPTLAKV